MDAVVRFMKPGKPGFNENSLGLTRTTLTQPMTVKASGPRIWGSPTSMLDGLNGSPDGLVFSGGSFGGVEMDVPGMQNFEGAAIKFAGASDISLIAHSIATGGVGVAFETKGPNKALTNIFVNNKISQKVDTAVLYDNDASTNTLQDIKYTAMFQTSVRAGERKTSLVEFKGAPPTIVKNVHAEFESADPLST